MRIETQRSLPAGDFRVVAVEGQEFSILYQGLQAFADAREVAMAASSFHGNAPIVDCVGERRHARA